METPPLDLTDSDTVILRLLDESARVGSAGLACAGAAPTSIPAAVASTSTGARATLDHLDRQPPGAPRAALRTNTFSICSLLPSCTAELRGSDESEAMAQQDQRSSVVVRNAVRNLLAARPRSASRTGLWKSGLAMSGAGTPLIKEALSVARKDILPSHNHG